MSIPDDVIADAKAAGFIVHADNSISECLHEGPDLDELLAKFAQLQRARERSEDEEFGYLWIMNDGTSRFIKAPVDDSAFYSETALGSFKEFHTVFTTPQLAKPEVREALENLLLKASKAKGAEFSKERQNYHPSSNENFQLSLTWFDRGFQGCIESLRALIEPKDEQEGGT